MQRQLHVWIITFLLGFFPLLSYGEYVEDYSYYDDNDASYQSQNESHSYYYYNANDDGYASNYANNFPAYDDTYPEEQHYRSKHRSRSSHSSKQLASRLAHQISPPGENIVIIDPRVHRWGAYDASGNLLREGITSAGSSWCKDIGRSCRTSVGTFRILSLGDSDCISRKYPLGRGGAPMPYCMYFNRTQALHGSNEVAEANLSHGCVRLKVNDAEWLRYNFVDIGTKVIVKPY